MFTKIVEDIKSVKIQGAENVAKAAIMAINDIYESKKDISPKQVYSDLIKAKKILEETRPTEPCMRNTLKFIFHGIDESNILDISQNILYANSHFQKADVQISKIGENKIKKGTHAFTFCHSSTVMGIFKQARMNKKIFTVNNTETRPLFQGRKTATELANLGIKVNHYADSAMRLAIKESDIVFIGADAITSEGKVINKIGSELVAEIAHRFDVPLYVCTNSWKFDASSVFGFDERIELRHSNEVWPNPPKGVKINNYAFEIVSPDLVTGVISELGIYSPDIFIEELQRNSPWIFKR